ncbi:Metallophosphoesterase domain-containing protein 1 [Geodia barretti]|uniref:Metallophosphoesterase domain-containing protein 1 n=1 Tax=Geodia barretti TaxID=519541 RepID=A0AA35R8J9_GEOBA|nr:Metallophosphoesterase domain-containing protein 1 [Geodia barretti]
MEERKVPENCATPHPLHPQGGGGDPDSDLLPFLPPQLSDSGVRHPVVLCQRARHQLPPQVRHLEVDSLNKWSRILLGGEVARLLLNFPSLLRPKLSSEQRAVPDAVDGTARSLLHCLHVCVCRRMRGGAASVAPHPLAFCRIMYVHPLSLHPNKMWDILKVNQKVEKVIPLAPSSPKPANHTRFVCISDTHSHLPKDFQVPAGDVLIHAGDFSNTGLPREIDEFRQFLEGQPHPHKVVIAGNHDLPFDVANYGTLWRRFGHPRQFDSQQLRGLVIKARGVEYLEDSGTAINGISLWGSPWQPEFCDWAFNLPRGQPCQEKWDLIPSSVDVLVTHGPPLGHGDLCSNGMRAGCVQLLLTIQQRVLPQYHVFGHIHEGYGLTCDGHTTFINCSTCNLTYQPVHPPVVFDVPNKL